MTIFIIIMAPELYMWTDFLSFASQSEQLLYLSLSTIIISLQAMQLDGQIVWIMLKVDYKSIYSYHGHSDLLAR
jgi:hypothetical protein